MTPRTVFPGIPLLVSKGFLGKLDPEDTVRIVLRARAYTHIVSHRQSLLCASMYFAATGTTLLEGNGKQAFLYLQHFLFAVASSMLLHFAPCAWSIGYFHHSIQSLCHAGDLPAWVLLGPLRKNGKHVVLLHCSSLPELQCFISDSQLTRDAALHLGLEDIEGVSVVPRQQAASSCSHRQEEVKHLSRRRRTQEEIWGDGRHSTFSTIKEPFPHQSHRRGTAANDFRVFWSIFIHFIFSYFQLSHFLGKIGKLPKYYFFKNMDNALYPDSTFIVFMKVL